MKHFIRTACAAALLVSGLAAEAGTVKFNSWAYGTSAKPPGKSATGGGEERRRCRL
jgi:hypothetical protein